MKKVCFVKLLRKSNTILGGFEWYYQNVKPFDDLTELLTSFSEKNFEIDYINFENVDSHTSVVLSIGTIDMVDVVFLDKLKRVFNMDCKNVFIELSCYDHQEIHTNIYDFCRAECKRELYFIDKNMKPISDDILFFEHHAYHTSMYIPKFINQFNDLNSWSHKFQKISKGLFLSGHIRLHKVELLNYLYVNGWLDKDFVWSSTDESFQPELYREFIPMHNEIEFRNFKVLEAIPKSIDFDVFDKWKYHNYPSHVNFMNYINTYFEIVPETHFYHRQDCKPTMDTRIDWCSISEKTCKTLRMNVPFIMVSKPNTIKYLTERFGFDVSLPNWTHEYDMIEDDRLRMASIKGRLNEILMMSKSDLHELHYEYFWNKKNNTIFIENFYNKPLQNIFNKF